MHFSDSGNPDVSAKYRKPRPLMKTSRCNELYGSSAMDMELSAGYEKQISQRSVSWQGSLRSHPQLDLGARRRVWPSSGTSATFSCAWSGASPRARSQSLTASQPHRHYPKCLHTSAAAPILLACGLINCRFPTWLRYVRNQETPW
jgi:hypothetical protein